MRRPITAVSFRSGGKTIASNCGRANATFVQDDEMEGMVRDIFDTATWWQKKGGPFPRPIFMSQEALDRFNQFKWEMGDYTNGHPNEESVEPSRQRLALSVWKIAVLLAMYEQMAQTYPCCLPSSPTTLFPF